MLFKQIDAAAMKSHRRRVGQLEPMLGIQLQNAMLGRWVAAIGFEHRIYGSKLLSVARHTPRAPSSSRTAVPATLSV